MTTVNDDAMLATMSDRPQLFGLINFMNRIKNYWPQQHHRSAGGIYNMVVSGFGTCLL